MISNSAVKTFRTLFEATLIATFGAVIGGGCTYVTINLLARALTSFTGDSIAQSESVAHIWAVAFSVPGVIVGGIYALILWSKEKAND